MTAERGFSGLGARLFWTIRKVRSKDRHYPLDRLSYVLRKRAVDRWFPRPGLTSHTELRLPEGLAFRQHFLTRVMPLWHFKSSQVQGIVDGIPVSTRDQTIAKADRIADGRFDLIGRTSVTLRPIDWDHACSEDVLWTRELNRHAIFEQLGFAFRYTSDPRYALAFVELARSWIEQYGYRIGRISWDKPFQVGRRINSWIWAYFLFLDWEGWSEADQRKYLQCLGLLTEYLHHTLERHSAGNHILLEAKALALCAEAFPEFAGANRWKRNAWAVLDHEMEVQMCADGVHAERSTMYHRIIAGELTELWLFCERNGLSRSRTLGEIVFRMAEFQRWIGFGDGSYPLWGDSLSRDSYYRFSAPAVIESRAGRPLVLEKGLPDHSWWLVDGTSRFRGPDPFPMDQESARAFHVGGYYVSRSIREAGPDVLVWDCGPMGYEANRNHAHADALSLVLSVEGEPILVDPGVGGPWEAPDGSRGSDLDEFANSWRDLRATSAHNTVSVDGEDQAILAERKEIWDPPHPRLSLWVTSADFDLMQGRHDGYTRLFDPVTHERLILVSRRGYWIILDALSGREVHEIEMRYHLAPGATLERSPSGEGFRVRKNSVELALTFFETDGRRDGQITFRSEERPGELSGGVPESLTAICVSRRVALPFTLGTVLTMPDRHVRVVKANLDRLEASFEIQASGELDRVRILMDVTVSGVDGGSTVDIQRFDPSLARVGQWALGQHPGNLQRNTELRGTVDPMPVMEK